MHIVEFLGEQSGTELLGKENIVEDWVGGSAFEGGTGYMWASSYLPSGPCNSIGGGDHRIACRSNLQMFYITDERNREDAVRLFCRSI